MDNTLKAEWLLDKESIILNTNQHAVLHGGTHLNCGQPGH
jgi:hypothetical protein